MKRSNCTMNNVSQKCLTGHKSYRMVYKTVMMQTQFQLHTDTHTHLWTPRLARHRTTSTLTFEQKWIFYQNGKTYRKRNARSQKIYVVCRGGISSSQKHLRAIKTKTNQYCDLFLLTQTGNLNLSLQNPLYLPMLTNTIMYSAHVYKWKSFQYT